MKQPIEMDQFDKVFKTMNHKLNMTEEEQKDVLQQINKQMNSKRQVPKRTFTHWKYYFTLASAALILILLAMPLLNSFQNKSDNPNISQGTQEEDIRTIEAVLQNTLTGPSEELKQIWDEDFEVLGKYEENRFKEYFADDMSFQSYVSRFGSVLMLTPIRNDYTLKVKNIKYEKTDSAEIIYNFSLELEYHKAGSELSEVGMVTGQANLNENHKIEDMLIQIGDPWNSMEENKEAKTQDENTLTIEVVLQNALTGPNEELEKIMEEMDWEEKLNQFEENLYRKHFANDNSYMEFVNSYGSTLMIEPRRNNYKLKVKNIEYEKADLAEIVYNFSVELEYQKEGIEKSEVEIVTGQANLNEKHKIEAMLIRMNDFLGSLGK